MVEDIGKIISKGLETYTKNLNLAAPFIITIFITGLLAIIIFIIGFFSIFGSSLASLEKTASSEEVISIILPIISSHLTEIVVLITVYFLISLFFQAFFMAGAIGMAKQATETGRSELSTMLEAGKKNVLNLYLAEILVGLLYLAGIVFLVPGAMKADISQLLSSENMDAILLLIAGFLLLVIYIIIINIVLAVFRYALVIDDLEPVDGILAGFRFFNKHKSDVFLLWLIIIAIIVVLTIIGQVMGFIPIMLFIWPFISVFISVFIIEPLIALWWVRLYMVRTGKKLYIDELLAHPSELENLHSGGYD